MTQPHAANINFSVTESRAPNARLFGAAVEIYALTLLAYSYLFFAGAQFIWDDDSYVINNTALRSADGLKQIWAGILPDPREYPVPQYYPMTLTSFWLEHQLWDLHPLGYHLVNVLLHATNALLLWIILRKLFVPGAWVIAAIFALHPVQVESVAWITERKNVLSGTFYFASLMMYLRYCRLDPAGAKFGTSGLQYVWALLLFICALLSKSVTGSLPAVVLLLIWWKRGRVTFWDVGPLVPFFACAVVMGWVTHWMEWNIVGASSLAPLSFSQKLIVAGRAPWFYMTKLIWPAGLTFIYPRWDIDPPRTAQFAYPFFTIAFVVALWLMRSRLGRGPLVAALFFVGTLFPALGFFAVFPQRYSFVADHFQYLACIGVIALIVARVDQIAPRASRAIWAAVIVALGALTWHQSRGYKNLESLWQATIARNPDAWMAHNNYGDLLLEQNRLDEAAGEFRRTLEIKPDHGEAMMSLGIIAQKRGHAPEAEEIYRKVLETSPPQSMAAAKAHAHLGALYNALGRPEDAAPEFEQAVALSPRSIDWLSELGMIYYSQSKTGPAIDCFNRMLVLDPNSAAAHSNMGYAMSQLGRSRDALAHWNIAFRQRPDDYRLANSMGAAYLRLGMRDMAISMFERALKIKPDYEPAKRNLAAASRK